jgi:hypothetical protein
LVPDVLKEYSVFFFKGFGVQKNYTILLGLLDPGQGSPTFLQNIGNCSPDDTVYIPENVNLQQHHWDHPQSDKRKKVHSRSTGGL